MALIRPGPLISAISGTIGGINFATSSTRPIIRKARRRLTNQAPQLITSRARLQYLTNLWTAQSNNTRAGWSTLAATLRWTDRIGQARAPTGRQFFLSHNLSLLLCNQALNTTSIPLSAPANITLITSLLYTNPGTFAFTIGQFPVPSPIGLAYYFQAFYGPVPQFAPPTASTPMGRLPVRWRFLKWASNGAFGSVNMYPEYLSLIGSVQSGQTLAVQARFVQTNYFGLFSRTHTAVVP